MAEYGVSFSLAESTRARLRDLLGRFASVDGVVRVETMAQLDMFAHELRDAIREEFIAAGHDRTGSENDPSYWNPSYVHTVDQLSVSVHGLEATIRLGGGALFVEEGTAPHMIEAVNGPYLTFRAADGDWVRTPSVMHPGTTADDFVGRAMDRTDAFTFLNRILSGLHFAEWGHAT